MNVYPLPRVRPKVKTASVPDDLKKTLAHAALGMERLAEHIIGEHIGSNFVALDPEVGEPLKLGLLAEKPIQVSVILMRGGSILTIEPRWDWPTARN